MVRRDRLMLLALLLGSFGLALVVRLPHAADAAVGSDSLGSYLAAWSALSGVLPKPPNPEGGHSLWLWAMPLVVLADSLEGLFRWRFAQGALIAPVATWAAWLLMRASGRPSAVVAGTVAGGLVALDVGLVDTLLSAFRGYAGPEFVGIATLGLVAGLLGHTWALGVGVVALVAAAGQHPLAFGVSLGALAVLPWLGRRVGWRAVAVAVGVGALATLPRLAWLWTLAQCDAGGVIACLGSVAGGSAEVSLGPAELVVRALHDWILVDHGPAAWTLGLGALLALAPRRPEGSVGVGVFALVGFLGVLLLGLSISTLRPYHFRHLAVPLAVLAGVGWGRLRLWGLIGLLPLVWAWQPGPSSPRGLRAAPRHDQLAGALPDGPLRVDALSAGRPSPVEASGVVLSAVLSGRDPDDFGVGADARVVVLMGGADALGRMGGQDATEDSAWTSEEHPSLDASVAALCPTLRPEDWVAGSYDWMVALHPSGATLEATRWACP